MARCSGMASMFVERRNIPDMSTMWDMQPQEHLPEQRKRPRKRHVFSCRNAFLIASGVLTLACLVLLGTSHFSLRGENTSDFPDGFDAVQAAPASHRVVFENAFIRVLYVTLPPAGSAEPMHYHRWPSVFLAYSTGGRSAHIRYHTPDGKVRDSPSENEPGHAGVWESGGWMKPERMHSIEVVENPAPGPGGVPGWLRVELKTAPK